MNHSDTGRDCLLLLTDPVKEFDDQMIKDLGLFDAADMTTLIDKAHGGFSDLFLRSSDTVDEEVVLLSRDKKHRQMILFDRRNVLLESELGLKEFGQPHTECQRFHLQ